MTFNDQSAAIFGASPGTGNLGVDALCWSTVRGLQDRGMDQINLFTYGANQQELRYPSTCLSGSTPRVVSTQVGKRVWRRDHVTRLTLESRAGIPGNPAIQAIRESNIILDVSGGDSFTDLYGRTRFNLITAPKRLALRLGKPLVLLPQTYGPFENPRTRRAARYLISNAALAYARDPASYEHLQTLLGDEFNPTIHRQGVDLAFGLPTQSIQPSRLNVDLHRNPQRPLIGINISGLLANQAESSRQSFALQCNYLELVEQFVLEVMASSNARVLLVPHVLRPHGHPESDQDACRMLLARLEAKRKDVHERIVVLNSEPNTCEMKWIIAQTEWFCGARMHATIAALSSGVPAAILAYSGKAKGIFQRAAHSEGVVDLRSTTGRNALSQLLNHWRRREQHRSSLQKALPGIQNAVSEQLDAITHFAAQNSNLAA